MIKMMAKAKSAGAGAAACVGVLPLCCYHCLLHRSTHAASIVCTCRKALSLPGSTGSLRNVSLCFAELCQHFKSAGVAIVDGTGLWGGLAAERGDLAKRGNY